MYVQPICYISFLQFDYVIMRQPFVIIRDAYLKMLSLNEN